MALLLTSLASKNVVTAATRVQLSATALYAYQILIQAKTGNTGKIIVGDSTVAANKGHELVAGATLVVEGSFLEGSLSQVNLADLWIDATVSGEGVNLSYTARRP